MSNENKTEETTEAVEETIEQTTETIEQGVETVEKSSGVASILALKDDKPAVFYGAIAGVVAVALLILGSGSDIKQHKRAKLVIGQSYTVQSSNSTGKDAVTPIVKVPGSVTAYDRNDDDSATVCLAKDGTRAKVNNFADAFGKKDLFVEVSIESSGDCEGKTGWLLVTNLS